MRIFKGFLIVALTGTLLILAILYQPNRREKWEEKQELRIQEIESQLRNISLVKEIKQEPALQIEPAAWTDSWCEKYFNEKGEPR